MRIAMPHSVDPRGSVLQHILDGTLAITSPEEFRDLLTVYKNDPFLHRKHADLLHGLGLHEEAAAAYETASILFIEQNMILQSVVAKILQWSILKATHQQGRAFYALLHEEGAKQTPLQRFWARMSYAELVAVMRRLVRVRLDPHLPLIRGSEPAEELYFVVSGTLREMPSPDCIAQAEREIIEIEPVLLGPNDVFGDVFPLQRPTFSKNEISTLTEVELVKIAKPVLAGVCAKYPRIGELLEEIRKPENRESCARSWQTARRALRYGLPTRAEILFYPSRAGQTELRFEGIAIDLSLGGMCMEIAEESPPGRMHRLKGRMVQINMDLLNEAVLLNLTGKIVWQRSNPQKTGAALLIGIRFNTLSLMDQEILTEYCNGSVGEQNLLWSLWDRWVKAQNTSRGNGRL